MGRDEEAFEQALRAIELDPSARRAYRIAGECCIRGRSLQEANARVQRALPGEADRLQLRCSLNSAFTNCGRYAEASENCLEILRAHPANVEPLRTLSQIA